MQHFPWHAGPLPAALLADRVHGELVQGSAAPRSRSSRHLRLWAAAVLHAGGRALSRWSEWLLSTAPAAATAAAAADPLLEFHAEAGAPEGALYVDGQLVARLSGVQRL